MANYSLEINIPKEVVATLNSIGEKLVIVKRNSSGTDLAWITFRPFPDNIVTWETVYGIYASSTKLEEGATITRSCYSSASVKNIYPFENGVFGLPTSCTAYKDNEYGILNKENAEEGFNFFTFGLAQDIVANGTIFKGRPISATTVMYNHTASFIPHEKICIFTEANIDDGAVITRLCSKLLELDFTEKSKIVVKYDSNIGLFVEQN